MKFIAALLALTVGLVLVPEAAKAEPVRTCGSLVRTFEIPGARTHVEQATEVDGYCDVRGHVEPTVKFQLKLPLHNYSGRYVQYGCHGLCGIVIPPEFPTCGGPDGGDMAVAATDDGHVGEGGFFTAIVDGRWAAGNQAARNDYFYRAPHVVSMASKRIITEFYGAPPKHSYYNGCSTGGREGLLLAQRYPSDFDGIVAGSPAAYNGPLMGVYFTWLSKVNDAPDGTPIITAEKLPALHDAALKACDGTDGLVDGQIDDPRSCRFDPGAIRCVSGTDRPDCLTTAQVTVARKLYDGPRDPQGRRLYPGWESRGSELAWKGSIIPDQGNSLAPLPDNYLKYVGFPIGKPHSSLAEFTFTLRDFHRLTPEGFKGNALSLDLSAFHRRGGKLLLWHPWDDQSIPAVGTLDYYQRLAERNGGLARTKAWARAFMVPTMYHCAFGGSRLTAFDPFPELVSWVEHGKAPDHVLAKGTAPDGSARTRPVYAYPARTKYDGTGDINDAANFVPSTPSPTDGTINWVGTYLHDLPTPTAQ